MFQSLDTSKLFLGIMLIILNIGSRHLVDEYRGLCSMLRGHARCRSLPLADGRVHHHLSGRILTQP